MRWTFFRRRPKPSSAELQTTSVATAEPAPPVVTRANVSTGSLARSAQLRDAALRFARDYLLASGAKVRVESPDLLSATQLHGRNTRYTSSLARARSGPDAELLAIGGEPLAGMIAEVERRAGVTSLRLAEAHDALAVLRRSAPKLPGAVPPDRYTLEEAEDALAIECAYELRARWRGGASHASVTLTFDAETVAPLPDVDDEALARAVAIPPPTDALAMYARASAEAEEALQPGLAATGRWLQLRGANEFAARQDGLSQTAERMIRESPEEAQSHRLALERESQRLRDLFAVTVEASLSRVAFVASPVRLARPVESANGPALRVDLGRGIVLPLAEPARATNKPSTHPGSASESLTVGDLALIPDQLWREAVVWLLEQMGHTVERTEDSPASFRAETRLDERAVTVIVLRREREEQITAADVSAALAGEVNRRSVRTLLTPNALGDDARSLLSDAGVSLMGPETLQRELLRLSSAYADQRAASDEQAEKLANQAADVRSHIIGELETLEAVLAQAANNRRATGAEIAQAAGVLRDVWALSDQVFVAWDTLLADWRALFPERAARDGSVLLQVDRFRVAELRERAEHLYTVTKSGLARMAETPGTGEMGYTAWRRALLEELTARCESLRWGLLATDPAHWRDFARLMDMQALERAETTRTSAKHARARAEKAYAQLAARARL